MAETYRRGKIVKFIKRLEVKKQVHADNEQKKEVLEEVIAELRHEFKIEEGE